MIVAIDIIDMKNHLLLIVQNLKDHVHQDVKDHVRQNVIDHAPPREKDHAPPREIDHVHLNATDHVLLREAVIILILHVNHMKARKQKNASENYIII
jgi:hypothetical protein